jgi:hypothetical protein
LTAAPHNRIEDTDAFLQARADVLAGRTAHAYLLTSSDSAALFSFSRALAALALFGSERGGGADLVLKDLWHDVTVLPLPTREGKKRDAVLTADVDAVTETLHRSPSRGDKKFYIIDRAETMNPPCQNKLLKSLEEPPAAAHFILNSTAPDALLPTVASRCRRIRVPDGGGTGAGFGEGYAAALALLTEQKSSKNVLAASAALTRNKVKTAELIGFMEYVLRDVAVLHAGAGGLYAPGGNADALSRLKESCSQEAALRCLEFTRRARDRLRLHGNQNGVADELLFNIAEARAKYK